MSGISTRWRTAVGTTVGTVAAAVVAGMLGAPVASAAPPLVSDPTVHVNPMVGTTTSGMTFPGASMPFGMVQNSPDTNVGNAAYNYDATTLTGFSQVHLSGIGCPAGSWIRVMPTVGDVTDTSLSANMSKFSHDTEVAKPGYYGVTLEKNNIRAELTSTTRTGVDRFTYDEGAQDRKLIVNVTDVWGQTFASDVKVVGNKIQGSVTSGSFCGPNRPSRYTLHFSMTLSEPIAGVATWNRGEKVPVAGRTAATGGAVISFAPGGEAPVVTHTGVSYTSVDGAERNRVAELATRGGGKGEEKLKSFDTVRSDAHKAWQKQLRSVRVSSDSNEDLKTFYTELYHSLLHPSVAQDVDGTYQGFDGKKHKVAPGDDYYQMLSMWDTYRSQNQLVALLEPERATDIARSILAIYEQGGWVPRWSLGQAETNATSGDPVTPFVVTLYSRGLLDDELAEKLFDALWKNVNEVPPPATNIKAREFNPQYLEKGYIPAELSANEAASIGLEYSLADCALGTMAVGLKKYEEADQLRPRCDEFTHIWNPGIESKGYTGFPHVRAADGSFVPTDAVVNGKGFKEGTAWQYQWLGQQHPEALFALMGGADEAEKRLDTFFTFPAIEDDVATAASKHWVTGPIDYNGHFEFNPNNEPDFHAPWMYAWTDSPWKTSAVTRAQRALYTDTYNGVPGNDDLGASSAMAAFAMLGFFEAQPGSGNYIFSAPMFPKAVITRPDGTRLTLNAPGAKASAIQYIDTLTVAGEKTSRSWISEHDLLSAGTVNFRLTTDGAGSRWGRGVQNQPPAMLGAREIPAATSTVKLKASDDSQRYGTKDPVTLTARVTLDPKARPAGTVVFRSGGERLATEQVRSGKAAYTLKSDTTVGDRTFTAEYVPAEGERATGSTSGTVVVKVRRR
ncbi:GH92 family glycosyl hydrolase [Streptomyces niveus]|uniref:GH92 family glycosyl hydrolase n=1 Tax=Streptomyces niveus TaxID=193462 RepID=UPI0034202774